VRTDVAADLGAERNVHPVPAVDRDDRQREVDQRFSSK
jgi:hypothetical protein